LRELSLDLADERHDAYSKGKYGEGVSLGHAFVAEDKDSVTIVAAEHEYCPVFVTIEYKPGPGRPLLLDRFDLSRDVGLDYAPRQLFSSISYQLSTPSVLSLCIIIVGRFLMRVLFFGGFRK
jgi:hypothetical protein